MQKKEEKTKTFRDLIVWQRAKQLAVIMYRLTDQFSYTERFCLSNQMRRATISISSNSTEGYNRMHSKEKKQFLFTVLGSGAERESQIEVAKEIYPKYDYENAQQLCSEVLKMLNVIIARLQTFMNMKNIKAAFLLATSYFLLATSVASAATLALDPSSGEYGPGDTFIAAVRLDLAEDECVNAATIVLNYPKDWMRASVVSKGESLFSLWADEPRVDHEKGSVEFSGGIPGGYCGRVAGDPGRTDILAKIVFTIPGNMIGGKTASGSIPLLVTFGEGTNAYLNDGFGTRAELVLRGAEYSRELLSPATKNEWIEFVHSDTFPPESFNVEVERDAQTFQNKYFIVFSTIDKQSGVHHYEVSEDDPRRLGYVRGKNEKSLFIEAKSPYLLTDQDLKSRIVVRAYDHNGNVAEKVVSPRGASEAEVTPRAVAEGTSTLAWVGAILALLAILAYGGWYWHKNTKSRSEGY